MKSKLVTRAGLKLLIKSLKKKKKKIAFTNGCFDIIHPGHIKLFKEAKRRADILIVGLNSDGSIKKIKGRLRPVLNQAARVEVLSSMTAVDYIVVFCESCPLPLIQRIKPDILVKGSDWRKASIIGRAFVESYGGDVLRVAIKRGYSTTGLIRKIKKYG